MPIKEHLFFSKSLMLSLINQGRIVYGAQEISFRVFFKKGIVFYTLFITTTSPFRALDFVFMAVLLLVAFLFLFSL